MNYLKYIFTDEPEKALSERYIFNLFVFLVSILFFLATLFNYVAQLYIVTKVSFAGTIIVLSIYFISRYFIYNQKIVVLFILASFLCLNALFITNFGFKGPIVYNFLTFGMAILFFLNKKNKIIFLLLLVVNLGFLAALEFNVPSLFGYYESDTVRLMDHAVNLSFSILTLALLFYLMIQYIETQKFKAEESDRIKSSFLANMSHEIRTPLNGIVGFSSLLNEENISADELSHFTEIIQSNSNHLAGLINDLIDISTIEANAIDLIFTPINLNSFLDQTLKKYNTIIFSKQKNIQLELDKEFVTSDSKLFVDKVRLSQILNNLIMNAINLSESERIHFGYTVSSSGKNIQFFVKDLGIGISKEDQDLIFQPFLKAKNAKYISKGGTGIGLTIAKKLVELMDGRMWLESSPNKGSSFYFTLPYYKNLIDIPSNKIL